MTILALSLWLFVSALGAGFLGSLTGLGGGVVLVPLLTLLFHVDLRYAIGASLVSVIATSSGAAATYVRDGYSNLKVGMLLEVATTLGAITAAFFASRLRVDWIAILFGVVLIVSSYLSVRRRKSETVTAPPDRLATWFHLDSSFPTPQGTQAYRVHNVPAGFGIMFIAGWLSGLLGIGSGAVKVLALDEAMHLPFKVSTTTSDFMIGVTAAASAGIYLSRGYIDPGLAMPVMLGVLRGSSVGARVLAGASPGRLRWIFAAVLVALGVEMIFNGMTGRL